VKGHFAIFVVFCNTVITPCQFCGCGHQE